MIKLAKVVTPFLIIFLIYLRVAIRHSNLLWVDELEQIRNLTTIQHLLFEYLPNIPAGLPGYYLITLPFNQIAPSNKYILGLPGLIGHILVFLLIPQAVTALNLVEKSKVRMVSLVARIFFTLDPRYIFQAMEVRPYSLLPLLWIASVILCSKLIDYDIQYQNIRKYWKRWLLLTISTVGIFIWHFYGFIMVATVYIFMQSIRKINSFVQILHKRSIYVLSASTFISFPIWKYFTSGLSHYRHNTFELLPNIPNLISRNWKIGILFIFLSLILVLTFFLFTRVNQIHGIKSLLMKVIRMLITLVFVPILIILFLDLLQPYWFLYRQFAWTMIPLYIAVGVITSTIRYAQNKPL